MDTLCTRCRLRNVAHARYCARCGQRLVKASACGKSGCSGGWTVFILMLVGGVWLFGGFDGLLTGLRNRARSWIDVQDRRVYELCDAKERALFELLRPDDVKVMVSRPDDHGISVQGTRGEVRAMDRLVQLLTRYEGWDEDDVTRELERSFPAFRSKTYRLPDLKANALHNILAFDNVPVLVMREWDGVSVRASPDDQQVIGAVVRILRGER